MTILRAGVSAIHVIAPVSPYADGTLSTSIAQKATANAPLDLDYSYWHTRFVIDPIIIAGTLLARPFAVGTAAGGYQRCQDPGHLQGPQIDHQARRTSTPAQGGSRRHGYCKEARGRPCQCVPGPDTITCNVASLHGPLGWVFFNKGRGWQIGTIKDASVSS